MEQRPLAPAARAKVAWVRNLALDRLEPQQADWRYWTAHGAYRLAHARAALAAARLPRFTARRRPCDAPEPAALTATPQR
jgi:hypothetical protein